VLSKRVEKDHPKAGLLAGNVCFDGAKQTLTGSSTTSVDDPQRHWLCTAAMVLMPV
jgi:hypothetical protein